MAARRSAALLTSAVVLLPVTLTLRVAPVEAAVVHVTCISRGLTCDLETPALSAVDAADPSIVRLSDTHRDAVYEAFSSADEYADARHPTKDDPSRDDITREQLIYRCAQAGCSWQSGPSSNAVSAPAWDVNGCPMEAPGVFKAAGGYVMWFDMASASAPDSCMQRAQLNPPAVDSAYYCLYYATATSLVGSWQVPDGSGLVCSPDGAIDPEPFSHDDRNYLLWKDGNVSGGPAATIQMSRLDSAGTALVPGTTRTLASQSAITGAPGTFARYVHDSTLEAPAPLITSENDFFLLFATGIWDSSGYEEGIIDCGSWSSLTSGSCDRTPVGDAPILRTGDFPPHTVIGPGSGTAVETPDKKAWLAYGSWDGCVGYWNARGGCRLGSRRVHVVELRLDSLPS
ncbi:MAG: family 43 glycosylhydrolase [Acidimicrobiales bacterium]